MSSRRPRVRHLVLGSVTLVVVGWLGPVLLRRASAQPLAPPASATQGEVSPEDSASSEPATPSEPPAPAPAPLTRAPVGSAAGSAAGSPAGMIHIAGGSFTMGSSDPKSPANERPRHAEVVRPFWIDKTEVTVEAYRGCVEAHSCQAPAKSSASCTYELPDAVARHLPVSCVHWRDADVFCRAVDKRLPREKEWEFAARGTRGVRFPWGGSSGCFYASTLLNDTTGRSCTRGPSPVGSHPMGASPLGVLDMSGNVEEWTADWYIENIANGVSPAAGASHALRGGGWQSGPSASRTTSRNWGSSMEAGPNVGFRCAKDD